MFRLLLVALFPGIALFAVFDNRADTLTQVYSCEDSDCNNAFIYCYGPILEAVNYYQIYNDSKTFVDMPMVNEPNTTLNAFNQQFPGNVTDIDPAMLRAFLGQYFTPVGSELKVCTPSDWQDSPKKLMKIADPNLRQWAMSLNSVWKTLCREIDPSIQANKDKNSLIYVPNQFIIPGGRFREFYYWDAYWIIKGLIVCDMYTSVKNMINNLATMVNTYGFVPNGGRVYYLKRSQPPLLSGMVYEYFEATQDLDFVKSILPILEKEQHFWNTQRQITIKSGTVNYNVYRYNSATNMPRAEEFHEDTIRAQSFNGSSKNTFWQHVASTAESGWDFSSRWFADKATFQQIETANIAPVDLNSFMCWNMDIMQYLYEKISDSINAEKYRTQRARFRDTVTNIFYNSTDGTWYDYNMRTGGHNTGFYPSAGAPLFANCYNTLDQVKTEQMFSYMMAAGVFTYDSGVPTSLMKNANQQWDYPNGWSPLNHIVVEGLRKSQNPQMQDQAFSIAKKWVLGNYRVWKATGHMWEKYDVNGTVPEPGFGGEYDVQDGFGWTNGVILDLLYTYGDRLSVPADPRTGGSAKAFYGFLTILCLVLTLNHLMS